MCQGLLAHPVFLLSGVFKKCITYSATIHLFIFIFLKFKYLHNFEVNITYLYIMSIIAYSNFLPFAI